MANSNSLRPARLKVTKVHAGSVRPVSTSPLASLPGNVAHGVNAPKSAGSRGNPTKARVFVG